MEHEIQIGNLAEGISVSAASTGLMIRHADGKNLAQADTWTTVPEATSAGKLLAQRLAQLVEQGAIVVNGNVLEIDYAQMHTMNEPPIEFDLLGAMHVPWSPYTLAIHARGYIGSPHFSLHYEFHLERRHHFPRRMGPFLQQERATYRLSPDSFTLLEAMDVFNALHPENKTKERALVALEVVKRLTNNAGLDDYLRSETVILPQRVKLDLVRDADGCISLVPLFDGAPAGALQQEFLRLSEVQPIYDLQSEDGTRTRVIVPEGIQDVLRDLQKIRHVGGATKERILSDVSSCFTDGVDRDLVDLSVFAPRVKGIGDVPVRAKVALQSRNLDWADCQNIQQAAECVTLEVIDADQRKTQIDVGTPENLEQLEAAVQTAVQSEEASIDFKGHTILVNDDLVRGLAEIRVVFPAPSGNDDPSGAQQRLRNCRYLIIYTNEEASEYFEGSLEVPTDLQRIPEVAVPQSLQLAVLQGGTLMRHQRAGVQWLQHLFRNREIRRGCLLADDMGLGKTLQVLTFLAWCVEDGYVSGLGQPRGPYEPILIVTPGMLMDNWRGEMERYFYGDIFKPEIILHGNELRDTCKKKNQIGMEIQLGVAKLDIDRVTRNRVVITNYHTVKNYQHSFARIDWSIIVTDEVQEIKNQNATSDALKTLKALFKIGVTGTPVENRLLELWNLVDYVQPGSLVGSARDFSNRYEKGIDTLTDDERSERMRELRATLLYERPDSFVLRREKESELSGLPKKIERRIECVLSETQRALYDDLRRQIRGHMHHFKQLHALRKICLHPILAHGQAPADDPRSLVEHCPKLRSLIDLLDEVRSKREKALIFCLDQRMQNILTIVLEAHFGLSIDTINGSTERNMRVRIERVEWFSRSAGFNLLILSPIVAGVGLNITAANHVVHYDRWWNPAKEAQATDRVYRIGQKKDVYVYYLLATDPLGQFESFDLKLDRLLAEKRRLAKDFLLPTEMSAVTEAELVRSILDHDGSSDTSPQSPRHDTVYDSLGRVAALDGHRFECLIAAMFDRKGYGTVLCPRSGDGGADLVAVNAIEVKLVQCKHTAGNGTIDHRAITDLRDASDLYRAEVFTGHLRRLHPTCVGVTNGRFDQETRARAARDGIVLHDASDLQVWIRDNPVSCAELEGIEGNRARNIDEVKEKLGTLSSAKKLSLNETKKV